jgi:hypothetical protein
LIDESTDRLDDSALARLESRIERARKEGR